MNSNNHLKSVGLIGLGGFAFHHFQMLIESGAANGMRLLAVADPMAVPESTKATIERHGIRRYENYEEMLEREALDAVFIATPIPTHFAMTASALRRGLRVYLEKPPVTSVRQIEELIRLDKTQSVQVGFNMMSWPVVRRTLQSIRRGEFGAIHSIRVLALWPRNTKYYSRASWAGKMGGAENPIFDGPATNAMSHYVQMLCAAGQAAGGGDPVGIRGEFYRARDIESYDTCSLIGRFADGPRFSVVMSHAAGPGPATSLTLETERGRVVADESLFSRIGRSRLGGLGLGYAHRDFGRFLNGQLDLPRVTLSDCVNFLQILSQGLSSSGGIASIPSEFVTRVGEGPEELCSVNGLRDMASHCSETFQTFSQAGAPWRQEASIPSSTT
jgi:predicted dehydrogenase